MKVISKNKMIGHWSGKFVKCPKCQNELLENKIGYRWCPAKYCDYQEINYLDK